MSDDPNLWPQIDALRTELRAVTERLARIEEQARARAEAATATQRKVDDLYTLAIEARGAGRAAALFGKWGYGVAAALGGALVTWWPAIKRAL